MGFLSTLTYNEKNKTELISKWERTGLLAYLDNYSDDEKLKDVFYYEEIARHVIKRHRVDIARKNTFIWAIKKHKTVIDDKKLVRDKVANIIIPIAYRDLRTKRYVFLFNISDVYDDVMEFVEDNMKNMKSFKYPTTLTTLDVESELISVYSDIFRDRMIHRHFRFKRLLTEKEI